MPRAYINGINIYYEVSGAGRSVLLHHGFTGSHQDWMSQVPALARKYQVVTMDCRGHGATDAPSSAGAYSIPIFAEDVHGLLQHLGISKCCLIGHSLGGFVALNFVLTYPQLITSLVLVDTAAGSFYVPGYKELQDKLIEIVRGEGMDAAFEYNARYNPMMQKRFEMHPGLREISKQRMLETSVDGYEYIRQGMSKREDLTPRLGEITVPTLVVVGEEDTYFHGPSRVMAAGIPDARLHMVPEATHLPHVEVPEVFNEVLLGFLSEAEGKKLPSK